MRNKFFTYKWIANLLLAVAIIAVYKTFDNLGFAVDNILYFLGLLKPFVVGLFMAYLLYLPAKSLEGLICKRVRFLKRFSRPISVLLVYVIAIALISVILSFVLPVISANVMEFGSMANDYVQNLPTYIDDLFKTYPSLNTYFPSAEEFVSNVSLSSITDFFGLSQIGKDLLSFVTGSVMSVASGLITFLMGVVISVYMLLTRKMIHNGCMRFLSIIMSDAMAERVADYARRINKIFNSFIYGALLDAAIVGSLATIALTIIGAPFPPLFGLFLMFANLIPYFGPIIGVAIVVLLTLIQSGYITGIITLIVLLVISQVDAHIMNPRIVGQSVGLKPLWIIFAITVGGGLFGFLGIVLGVPVLAALRILIIDIIDYIEKRRQNRRKKKDLEI